MERFKRAWCTEASLNNYFSDLTRYTQWKQNRLIFFSSLSYFTFTSLISYLLTVEHSLNWDSVRYAVMHSNKEVRAQKKAFTAHRCKWIHEKKKPIDSLTISGQSGREIFWSCSTAVNYSSTSLLLPGFHSTCFVYGKEGSVQVARILAACFLFFYFLWLVENFVLLQGTTGFLLVNTILGFSLI